MKLNKTTAYVLLYLLNGAETAAVIAEQLADHDIRSVQRALARLTDLEVARRSGPINNPTYALRYERLLPLAIPDKILEDEDRPASRFNHELIDWLLDHVATGGLNQFTGLAGHQEKSSAPSAQMSLRDLEYLTVELSWKSSALEGNTYTLLDTQLLLLEGVKAPNRTSFETQMILNHKDTIKFIVEHQELFSADISFAVVEELHRLISYNLGIPSGIRRRLVRIGASNYTPLASAQQLREQADLVLTVINRAADPGLRSLLALGLIPYLQLFEDGNKRTGRLLANAILISTIGKGFSLRSVSVRDLSFAYLAFYEFNSLDRLAGILKAELKQR